MDYGDLAYLTGDTQAQDVQHQSSASSAGSTQSSQRVIRLAAGMVIASVILLWLLGMTFR